MLPSSQQRKQKYEMLCFLFYSTNGTTGSFIHQLISFPRTSEIDLLKKLDETTQL